MFHPEKITLKTSDGVRLAGLFLEAASPRRGTALLLHMMPATKESWLPLMERLAALGVQALAIDLRGHGESRTDADGRALDSRAFTDVEHQAKRLDVEAAARWLVSERAVAPESLVLVGASIGANLAVRYAADHQEVPAVAALSPGLDYRGVTADDAAARLAPYQRLLLVAGRDDLRSAEAVRELAALKPDATLMEFEDASHGTNMFERRPELEERLAAWLAASLTPDS